MTYSRDPWAPQISTPVTPWNTRRSATSCSTARATTIRACGSRTRPGRGANSWPKPRCGRNTARLVTRYADSYADRPHVPPAARRHPAENVPEYLFLLCGAAMAGVTIGINPTRRGAELAPGHPRVDCDVIVHDDDGAAARRPGAVPPRVWARVGQWRDLLAAHAGAEPRLTGRRDPHAAGAAVHLARRAHPRPDIARPGA